MSGVPETGVPRGASERVPSRPSVFDTPGPAPVLPPTAPSSTFQRQAEPTAVRPSVPAPTIFYRSDQDRARSVYRRANPWYRRLARGAVALCLVIVVGGGLYFGARALQDYLGRDRLPSPGAEIPEIASATFVVTSAAPAPVLDGSFEIDVTTGAYRYEGNPDGAQSGLVVASLDGAAAAVSTDGGDTWRAAGVNDPEVAGVQAAIPYLLAIESSDDLLGNRVRDFVTLVDQTTEGIGAAALDRYEMRFDTQAFSEANPLLWASFEQDAVPGIASSADVPITMWLDQDDVVVRLRDSSSNWSWERTSYSAQPATIDPDGAITAVLG
jgi:hypothetical protein